MRLQVIKQDLKCEYDKINMQKFILEMEKNALCSSKFEEVGHPTEESYSPIQATSNLRDLCHTTKKKVRFIWWAKKS